MKKIKCLSLLLLCVTFCANLIHAQTNLSYAKSSAKMSQMLKAINDMYVDTVNFNTLVENGIVEMLKELDPHSVYIPQKEVQQTNEPLQGSFDGIGVSFQIIKDTINIVDVIVNGPSEKVGILAGDKILKVDTLTAYGKSITNDWVRNHLRGTRGTKVKVSIKRGKSDKLLEFTITRDKIPMNSINVSFMVDKETGYIRLERFAQNSTQELETALKALKKEGLKNLIFDLRGNGGGYLDVAFKISDEFIKDGKMIVYTNNFRGEGQKFIATGNGNFEKGKLVILIDEGSASASEIVSGAVQDWDRGIIMGRRSFGKGLVQKPLFLNDQSMVRLTISKYYTPTGRCIQKPYNDGLESYSEELYKRAKHGEYYTPDSIRFPDSLKYTTPNGRIVYGGGGIMPDIFIPLDTTKYSSFYSELVRKGIFDSFTIDYMDSHKDELKKSYPTMVDFKEKFVITDALYDQFLNFAKKEGVTDSVPFDFSRRLTSFVKEKKSTLDSLFHDMQDIKDSKELNDLITQYVEESYSNSVRLKNTNKAPEFIKDYLKFAIARNLFNFGQAYQIFLMKDDAFIQACNILKDEKAFKTMKIAQ